MSDLIVSVERLPRTPTASLLPSDKSISHRALLIGAATPESTLIHRINEGSAVRVLIPALEKLGAHIEQIDDATLVCPPANGLSAPNTPTLNLGASSAAARLLLGLLAGLGVRAVIDGDDTLRARPMEWVVDPLRELGIELEYLGALGRLPVAIRGGHMHDGQVRMSVGSAQASSAILLAAFAARRRVEVNLLTRSRDHTQRLLRHVGVEVSDTLGGVLIHGKIPRSLPNYFVPVDPSAAAYLAAAHILQGSEEELILDDVCLNPTRTGFFEMLAHCGVALRYESVNEVNGEPVGRVIIGGTDELRPFRIQDDSLFHAMIDEVPLACALATWLPGCSSVMGASELSFKETNRLLSTRDMLRAFGAQVEVEDNNIHVQGGVSLHAGVVPSFNDHRIAMSAAVLACSLTETTRVLGGDCYQTSFPNFPEALHALGIAVCVRPRHDEEAS